ncbi:MAG: dienelactone hydrolase family protein, partial [Flavobacteriales bacterium]|nr:dienelactone hydrolase family protein [Flavobacteriales bacterium]
MRSFLFAVSLLPLDAVAQFPIGSTTITFIDATRGGRLIPCEVYYPAVTAGANADVATGSFPVLSFGHGFAMGVGAYANLWQDYVPEGYIMVLPTTEAGLLPPPSHGDFGLDLAFAIGGMQAEGNDPGSLFFEHVSLPAAVMGHSMGGGASLLAAAGSPLVTTVVNYAPAETNPSSIAAASNVNIPVLVIAGSEDCVTPPASNQVPMYNAVPSGCKAYVELTGGGHCNFANSNFNCSFGEFTCGGAGSLGRPAQQALAQQHTLLWLDRFLKDDVQAGADFEALLVAGQGITSGSEFTDCPTVPVQVEPKLLLDGPYDELTDLMADNLRMQGLLPTSEPNTAAGLVHVGSGAGETLDPGLLSVTGPDALVDWVFLELRDAATGTQVLATA